MKIPDRSTCLFTMTMMAIGLGMASPAAAQTAQAPAAEPRFELGGQLSTLRASDLKATNPGFGGRFAYDFTDWLAAEAEVNFFPHEDYAVTGGGTPIGTPAFSVTTMRRRGEGFFGPKIGRRLQHFGLFAKVRPGFTRLGDRGVECNGTPCAALLLIRPDYRTEFAMDLGAVLEYYPTQRLIVRFDLGDTMIHHRGIAPPYPTSGTSHNFTPRFGFGFRF